MIDYIEEFDYQVEELICPIAEFVLKKFELPLFEVEIIVTDNQRIAEINTEFRQISSATDVLSFPNFDGEITASSIKQHLGSIIISYPRAVCQAQEYGHSLKRELAFLTAHGILHLLGYDHMEPEEEKEMIRLSEEILAECQIFRLEN